MSKNYDKEFWDKIGFNNYPQKYQYVKLSTKVKRILRPKVGNEILLSYYYFDKGRKVKMLNYASYNGVSLDKGPGYCSEDTENCIHSWETLAQSLADSYPKYAVKHRDKKNE